MSARHTAVVFAAGGIPLERIADYMGHSSTHMTNHYRHLIDGQREADRRQLDDYLNRDPERPQEKISGTREVEPEPLGHRTPWNGCRFRLQAREVREAVGTSDNPPRDHTRAHRARASRGSAAPEAARRGRGLSPNEPARPQKGRRSPLCRLDGHPRVGSWERSPALLVREKWRAHRVRGMPWSSHAP